MSYEDWRKQFSSDEEAARRGFEQSMEMAQEINELQRDRMAHDIAYNAMKAQRDDAIRRLKECEDDNGKA